MVSFGHPTRRGTLLQRRYASKTVFRPFTLAGCNQYVVKGSYIDEVGLVQLFIDDVFVMARNTAVFRFADMLHPVLTMIHQ